jgi:hypothetical protein
MLALALLVVLTAPDLPGERPVEPEAGASVVPPPDPLPRPGIGGAPGVVTAVCGSMLGSSLYTLPMSACLLASVSTSSPASSVLWLVFLGLCPGTLVLAPVVVALGVFLSPSIGDLIAGRETAEGSNTRTALRLAFAGVTAIAGFGASVAGGLAGSYVESRTDDDSAPESPQLARRVAVFSTTGAIAGLLFTGLAATAVHALVFRQEGPLTEWDAVESRAREEATGNRATRASPRAMPY